MVRFLLNYGLLFIVGALDHVSGAEVHFGSFYLLAVAAAAWSLRSSRAVVVYAVAAAVVWVVISTPAGASSSRAWIRCWNVVNQIGITAIVATAVSAVRATLGRQRQLIQKLGRTALSASQLRELIPVCQICHALRPGPDYGVKLGEFLRENPDADAVGGICPDCQRERAARIARIPVDAYFQTDAD